MRNYDICAWPGNISYWGRGQIAALFADDNFICMFLYQNFWISNKISLKYVPCGLIDNKPPLIQIMGCRRTSEKPLSEPMKGQFADAFMRYSASLNQNWLLNSLRPNDAYMRRWTGSSLVQIMACRLPSHHLNQCWNIVNWTFRNKLQ